MSVDASEMDKLAHDMGLIPGKLVKKIKPIMGRTGLQVKNQMRKDARGSRHFKQLAPTINYDVREFGFDGDGVIQVEIGPDTSHNSASLAGIAYFGTSRPGGGTVRDPAVVMRLEEPKFLGYLEMAAEGLL